MCGLASLSPPDSLSVSLEDILVLFVCVCNEWGVILIDALRELVWIDLVFRSFVCSIDRR